MTMVIYHRLGNRTYACSASAPLGGIDGIDTLTGAVGRNGSLHGSGCDAALLPDSKRLGTKILEDTAWQKMALDVEGVLDGGVDREETLG